MRYNPTPYRPRDGERFAEEVQVAPAVPPVFRGSGSKRVMVRPGRPAQYRGFGAMPTAPVNDAPTRYGTAPRVVVDCGAAGDYVPRMKREKRADGSRMAYEPKAGRPLARADLTSEFEARFLVEQALTRGEFVHKGRVHRLVPTATGAVRTIPDKGSILRWASVEDLVQAIATGAF